jgi:hypothetical protein
LIAPNFHTENQEFLNDLRDNLRVQLKRQGRKATGRAINSLRVVSNQKLNAELRGVGYLAYLQTGVGSKPKAIGSRLISNLMEWISYKGITPAPKQTIKQMAFAIANTISADGTRIFQRKEKGISISQAIKETKPKFLKEIGQKMIIDFKKGLKVKRK